MSDAAHITCVCLTRWPERAGMLADALRCFVLQTHEPRDMVLVNDGAPLRSLDPRVRVVNLTRRISIGEKRNVGLEHAREFAATWDDDDAAFQSHLSTLLAVGAPWVRSARVWLADAALSVVGLSSDPTQCTTLVRTELARRAGGYPDVDYAEDVAISNRIRTLLGIRTGGPRAEPVTYVHRRHRANVSRGHSTAGLDAQVARGLAARAWWTDPGFAAATARVRALQAAPIPGPWPLVAPEDGRPVPASAVPSAPRDPVPYPVDAIVDATSATPAEARRTLDAARDARCLRRLVVLATDPAVIAAACGPGTDCRRVDPADRGALLRAGLAMLPADPHPGAVVLLRADVAGLRRDHVCDLSEWVRAGGAALAVGLPDLGDVGNKVHPWLPGGHPDALAANAELLASVPEGAWTDDDLVPSLREAARRAGARVATHVLDGVATPASRRSEPLAARIERALAAVDRARRGSFVT